MLGPNDRFLPPVEAAFAEAEEQQTGLLDPAHGCTIPAQVQQATTALADAVPTDLADAAGEVAADAARRAVVPAPAPAPAPKPAPNPGANIVNHAPPGYYADIPGYTGPRCYAPGGKFFKPC